LSALRLWNLQAAGRLLALANQPAPRRHQTLWQTRQGPDFHPARWMHSCRSRQTESFIYRATRLRWHEMPHSSATNIPWSGLKRLIFFRTRRTLNAWASGTGST